MVDVRAHFRMLTLAALAAFLPFLTALEVQAQGPPVNIWFSDGHEAQPGEAVTLPLLIGRVRRSAHLSAFEVEVDYDPALMSWNGIDQNGTVLDGWDLVVGNEPSPGRILIAAANSQGTELEIDVDATLLGFDFTVSGGATPGDCSALTLTNVVLNSGTPAANTYDGQLCVVAAAPASADLSLSQTADVEVVEPGNQVVLTLTVHNDGPDTATGVSVTANLPAGLTYQSDNGGGDYVGGIWSVGTLASGADSSLAITVISSVTTAVANTAEITAADQGDPDSTPDNGNTDEDDYSSLTIRSPQADLSLSNRVSSTSPFVNDIITFSLTLTNEGPDAVDNVTVAAALPAGLTLVDSRLDSPVIGRGSTYSNGVWSISSLAPESSTSLEIQASGDTPGSYSFTAEVSAASAPDPDSTPDNGNTSEDDLDTAVVVLRPALGAKITIVNGDGPGVGLNDATPVSATGGNPGTTLGEQRMNALQFAADLWSTYLLSDVEIRILARFESHGCPSDVLAQGWPETARRVSGSPNPLLWYPIALANTIIGDDGNGTTQEANLVFNLDLDGGCVGGQPFYYGLDGNAGNRFDAVTVALGEIARGLGLHSFVNTGTGSKFFGTDDVFSNLLEAANLGQSWSEMSNNGRLDSAADTNNLVWNGDNANQEAISALNGGLHANGKIRLAANSSSFINQFIMSFHERVNPDQVPEEAYNGPNHDPGLALQMLYDIGWSKRDLADISLTLTVDNPAAAPDETVTFTITVHNDGPDQAENVEITALLPGGFDYVSHSGGTYSAGNGTWDVGTLGIDSSTTLEIRATVLDEGIKELVAELTNMDQGDPDSSPNNGLLIEDDMAAQSVGAADLSLQLSVDNATPHVDDEVVLTLTVRNDGPDDATGITVEDRLDAVSPVILEYVSHDTGTYDSDSGIWDLGRLNDGEERTLRITARVATAGSFTNVAEILTSDMLDSDSVPGNGVASEDDRATVSIRTPEADLSLVIELDNEAPLVGDEVTLTFILHNNGPDAASGIQSAIQLSADLSFVSSSGGTYNSGTGLWTINSMGSSGDRTLDLVVRVESSNNHTVTAEIQAAAESDPDSEHGNGATTEDDYARLVFDTASADLSLALIASSGSANVGDEVTFTYTVTNLGPDAASGVTVAAPLPSGLSHVSNDGTYDVGSGTWSIGGVSASSSRVLHLVARVDASGTHLVAAEIATAEQDDPDSTPGNGDDSEDDYDAVAIGQADLSLSIAVSDRNPFVGDEITIDVTLTNNGPDDATRIQVAAPLPVGLVPISSSNSYNEVTGIWSAGITQAGTQDFLTIVARVDRVGSKTFRAQVSSVDQVDPDSTPGNSVPSEDDDQQIIITPQAAGGATITIVNLDPPGVGLNDPTPVQPVGGNPGTTLGQQRLNALQYAADLWGASLHSDVDIYVRANFNPLACTASSALLGSAGPRSAARNFPGATRPDTWFPIALANALAGTDLNGSSGEISAQFNRSIDNNDGCLAGRNWYYGLDANNNGEVDLVTTALHELCHGLGQLSFVNSGGSLLVGMQDIYSSLMEDHSTGKAWTNMSDSERAASMRDTGDLHWRGSSVTANSGSLTSGVHSSGHVEMYAPTSYASGSSVHHFSNSLFPNALMEPFNTGANHDPGLSLNLMQDIGWPTGPSADLRLSHGMSGDLGLGDLVTITLSVNNEGPAQTTGVQVVDVIPAGLIFQSANTLDGSYDDVTGTWDIGTMDPGDEAELTLTVEIASAQPQVHTAQVTASSRPDPDSTPNNGILGEDDDSSLTITPTYVGTADLSLAMIVDNATPDVGDEILFSLTVTNDGPDDATGVVVRDQLPTGLAFVSSSGGTYTAGNGNWNVGSLSSGASASLDITARVLNSTPQVNRAMVQAVAQEDPDSAPGNDDPAEDDQVNLDITPVSPGTSDLSLQLIADTTTPGVGDSVTLTLALTNSGPDSADEVTSVITLSGDMSITSSSGDGTLTGNEWRVTGLASGATANLDITATIGARGTRTLRAEVTGSIQEDPDSTPGNGNTSEDDYALLTLVPKEADLALTMSVNQPVVGLGDRVIFTLVLENAGPSATSGVTVGAALPAGLTYQSHSGSGSYSGGTWTVGNLTSGQTASLLVEADTSATGSLVYRAEVTASDEYDPDSTPNNGATGEDDRASATVRTQSGAVATILIENGDGPGEGFNDPTAVAPIGGNSGTTLGQQRLNAFQHAADIWSQFIESDVTIVIRSQFDPLTCSSSSGILGSAGAYNVARNFPGAPQQETWYHIALANALSASDLNGSQPEILARFNSSIDNNSTCLAGTNWYYGLDGNGGAAIDLVAVLLHEFAHGLGFSTFVNSQTGTRFYGRNDVYMNFLEDHASGLPWSEMSDAQRRDSAVSNGQLDWIGGNLGNATGILDAGVNETHAQIYAPTAFRPGSSVSHFSTALSPNELMEPFYTGPNHDPGLAVPLFADLGWGGGQDLADLSLSNRVDNPLAGAGARVTFSVTVTNSGPSPATGVEVTNLLPSGYSYVSHSGTGSYNNGTGLWDIGPLNEGQSEVLQIEADVLASGDRTSVAEITAADQIDPDSVPGNGDAAEDDYDQVTVGSADLRLDLALDDATPDEGQVVTVTVKLFNDGPDDAGDIRVSVPVGEGLTLVSSDGAYDGQTGMWQVGSLAADNSTQLAIQLRVDTDQTTSMSGQVWQSNVKDPDSTPANGIASEDDQDAVYMQPIPSPKADLNMIVAVTETRPEIGEQVTISVEVLNNGPNTTQDVTMEVRIPANLSLIDSFGDGSFDSGSGLWTIGLVSSSGRPERTLVLEAGAAGNANTTFEIMTSSLPDPDSVPGNGVESEDDQVTADITVRSNLPHRIIIQNADGAGEGFNDTRSASPVGGNPGTTIGQQRLNAFQYAADIWAAILDLSIDVTVQSQFNPLDCSSGGGILGSAGPYSVERDFPGAPVASTWYPAALANHLSASDINGGSPEIVARFNSSIDNNNSCLSGTNWYYGLDGNAGNNIDLVSVLLHEMGHGLGFLTLVNPNGDRFMDRDDIFMRYLEDHSRGLNWHEMGIASRATSARDTGDLHWTGPAVVGSSGGLSNGVGGGGHVEMYAPSSYQNGSSVSHFSTNLFPNELMEPSYTGPDHDPGLATQLMLDIGWGEVETADLSLEASVDDEAPTIGDVITFTVTLENDGPDDASGVTVSAPIPSGYSYSSDSGDYDSGSGVWSVGNVTSGGSATLTLSLRVDGIPLGIFVSEVATSAALDPDSSPGNGSSNEDDDARVTVTPDVGGDADLDLSVSVNNTSPNLGENVSYTVTVHNDGPDLATTVNVSVLLPSGMTLVTSNGTYTNDIWTVGTLTSGGSATLNLTARVDSAGTKTLVAEVEFQDQSDPDSTPGNRVSSEDDYDTASIVPFVPPLADLSLAFSVDDGNPLVGSLITFELSVMNDGPENTDGVEVRAVLPNGLLHVSDDGGGAYAGGIFTVGPLDAGESATLFIQALVEEPGTKTVVAQVSDSDKDDPDSTPDNNVESEDDQVTLTISPRSGGGATIIILNADSPGEGFNDSTPTAPVGGNSGTTLGAQRLNAFQYAADQWAQYLSSDVEIVVSSQFNPLTCTSSSGVLGSAGPMTVHRDFPEAPLASTWYTAAQTNALTGRDVNGSQAEIRAQFNSSIDNNNGCLNRTNWYYGLDGRPGGNIDLVSVLMHEMGHGLGFLSLVNSSGTIFNGYMDVYSSFLEDHRLNRTFAQMSTSQRASAMVSSGQLHWTGPNVRARANELNTGFNGDHVEMYAPNPYRSGSSVSHFSTSLSPNELMEPSYAEVTHDPNLSAELLYDLGWPQRNKADLSIEITSDVAAPANGETVTFTVAVSNAGPAPATGVMANVSLESGLTYSGDDGAGNYDSGSSVWDVGLLPVGGTTLLEITAVAGAGGKLARAEVTASDVDDPDSAPNNGNLAEDDMDLVSTGSADLSLELFAAASEVLVGDLTTLTLNLHNEGPDKAYRVEVNLPVPTGTSFVSAGSGYDATSGKWTPGDLDAGQTRSLDLVVRVDSSGSIGASAEVASVLEADPDSTPSNGIIGEDDDSDNSFEAVEPTPANLELQVDGFFSNNCPNMSVRLMVSLDGAPVNSLNDTAFSLSEDGTPLSFSLAAISTQGEYELTYATPRPDGLQHTVDISVQVDELSEFATATVRNCHISGVIQLSNNVPVDEIAGFTGGWRYYRIDVPANQGLLEIAISGGTGDADLYVKYGNTPLRYDFDYRPLLVGNEETVTINNPRGGSWYIGLLAVSDYADVTLQARYAALRTTMALESVVTTDCPAIRVDLALDRDGVGIIGLTQANFELFEDGASMAFSLVEVGSGDYRLTYTTPNADGDLHTVGVRASIEGETFQATRDYRFCNAGGVIDLANWQLVNGLSGSQDAWIYFRLNVPTGQDYLQFRMFGGSGDADMYVLRNDAPTLDNYSFAPRLDGNTEEVLIENQPGGGDWYIGIYGYRDFRDLSLVAGYGFHRPNVTIDAVSVAGCPEIVIDATVVDADDNPITGLGTADFTITEDSGTPFAVDTVSEVSAGQYRVTYSSSVNSGNQVFIVLEVSNNGVKGLDDSVFDNCSRDGGSLDVWINRQHEGLPGEQLVVPVHVQAVDSAYAVTQISFSLYYDSSLLTYIGTDGVGTLSENWDQTTDSEATPGELTLAIADLSQQYPLSASQDSVLVNLLFDIDVNALAETCGEFSFQRDAFIFNNGTPMANLSDGLFCVTPGSCPRAVGDVNADGNDHSAFDASLILNTIDGTPTAFDPIPLCVADTNCSGDISLMDALLVLQKGVELITEYCATDSGAGGSFNVTIPAEQLALELGQPFQLTIELDQIVADPIYGYRFELTYDDRYLQLDDAVIQDATLTSRWGTPIIDAESGRLTVTHLSPTAALEETGTLLVLTGTASQVNEGSSSLTFNPFTLGSATEPESSFQFTVDVSGDPCFDEVQYFQSISTWPNNSVLDILDLISCLNP